MIEVKPVAATTAATAEAAPPPALPTALFIAAREGHRSLVEMLLQQPEGVAVSVLPGPGGKLAGEVFGKGVDGEVREEICTMLADARARARKVEDSGTVIANDGVEDRRIECAPKEEAIAAATVVTSGESCHAPTKAAARDRHRRCPSTSSLSLSPSVVPPTGVQRHPSSTSCSDTAAAAAAPIIPPSVQDASETLPARAPVASLTVQADATKWQDANVRGSNGGVGASSGGNGGQAGSAGHPSSRAGGGTVDFSAAKRPHARFPIESVYGLANNQPAGGYHLSETSPTPPRFAKAIEQPLSAHITAATMTATHSGRKPSGSGEIGGSKLSLAAAPGLPTPQEWRTSVRQNGVSLATLQPPRDDETYLHHSGHHKTNNQHLHQRQQQEQQQQQPVPSPVRTPPVASASSSSSVGIVGADSPSLTPLAPVAEVVDG
ncbi:unnamed protein product, partial [Sphacelaria rigidula]